MKSEREKITVERCKDSGLALVLICLLSYQAWRLPILMLLAVIFLLAAMAYPPVFRPFARLWFAFSTILGTSSSKAILSVLFFGLVLPVGLARWALGKDPLRIRCWKKNGESVFRVRDHRFVASDLEHPY